MTCYELLVSLADKGERKIHINLKTKSLKVSKQQIIENGNVMSNKIFGKEFDGLIDETLDIDDLYIQYKYSTPGSHDSKRPYFKALSADKLTDVQLAIGIPRLEAQVRLEAYILLAAITGKLTWQNPKHFFWQSKRDNDFVILKSFIEKEI